MLRRGSRRRFRLVRTRVPHSLLSVFTVSEYISPLTRGRTRTRAGLRVRRPGNGETSRRDASVLVAGVARVLTGAVAAALRGWRA